MSHLPLIWQGGPIFEDELRINGATEAIVEREKILKRRIIVRSQLNLSHTETGAETIRAIADSKASRVRVLPFFLPHLRVVEREAVERKFEALHSGDAPIRMLFVGREARRKGLPAVLEAFEILNARMPCRLQLEIVSTLADGSVYIPAHSNIIVYGETLSDQVQEKMRQAHFLLMPSRFETFGWVYLEAMAAGAIAIVADLPPQREILAGGSAGLLVPHSGEQIAERLQPLLRVPAQMLELALGGGDRVLTEYEPHGIASRFHDLGLEAQELFQADHA